MQSPSICVKKRETHSPNGRMTMLGAEDLRALLGSQTMCLFLPHFALESAATKESCDANPTANLEISSDLPSRRGPCIS
jgi:hypothetical protein